MADAPALAVDLGGPDQVDPALTQQPFVLVERIDGGQPIEARIATHPHPHVVAHAGLHPRR